MRATLIFLLGCVLQGCALTNADNIQELAGYALNVNQQGSVDEKFHAPVVFLRENGLGSSEFVRVNNQEIPGLREATLVVRTEDQYNNCLRGGSGKVLEKERYLDEAISQIMLQFERYAKNVDEPVIKLFIHGGLVGLDLANLEAVDLLRVIEAQHRHRNDFKTPFATGELDYFPIFLNWDTGPFSAMGDSFTKTQRYQERRDAREPAGTFWGGAAMPFIVFRELLGAIGRTPFVIGGQLRSSILPAPTVDEFPAPENWSTVRFPEGRVPKGSVNWVTEVVPGAARVISPAYDFLGSGAYDEMLWRAGNLVRRDNDFVSSYRSCSAIDRLFSEIRAWEFRNLNEHSTCTLHEDRTRYVDQNNNSCYAYGDRIARAPDGKQIAKPAPVTIDIIAHSLGALVGDEIIAENPDLWFRNITYMAPANTIGDFRHKSMPYLRYKRHTHPGFNPQAIQNAACGADINSDSKPDVFCPEFHLFTLHPENEYRETNFYKLVPKGSLLTYIDRFLAHPVNAYDRTLGDWRNLSSSMTQLAYLQREERKRIHVTVFGKMVDEPQMHGQFNDPPKVGTKENGYPGRRFWTWSDQHPWDVDRQEERAVNQCLAELSTWSGKSLHPSSCKPVLR